MIIVLFQINLFAQFAGGSGTQEDPYQIATIEQLQAINTETEYLGKHFIQIGDIDASETINWNEGHGFIPIGVGSQWFTGSYNGNNFFISDLYINPLGSYESIGVFSFSNDAIFQKIVLNSLTINMEEEHFSGSFVGGLVGYATNSIINDCSVNGSIISFGNCSINAAGGLVGWIEGTVIGACRAFIDIDFEIFGYGGIGGILGGGDGNISNCQASGNIAGNNNVGGLVGELNSPSLISFSTADCNVTGNERVGGLVGWLRGDLENSYSGGSVAGNSMVGGISGVLDLGTISKCYSYGLVEGDVDGWAVAGFVGLNEGTTTQSYWNIETAGQTDPTGGGNTPEITGLTTAQMTGINALESMTDLDIGIYWQLTIDFPVLYWEDYDFIYPETIDTPILVNPLNGIDGLMNAIEFNWNVVPFADNYTLQFSIDENFNENVTEIDNITATNYESENLPWNSTIYWRVKATNSSVVSEWSEEWSFEILPEFAFVIPSGDSYCEGDQIMIEGTVYAQFEEGNKFIIELSDVVGDFDNAIILAEVETTDSFTTLVSVPETTILGQSYQIRVRSTDIESTSDTLSIIYHQIPTSVFSINEMQLCWLETTNIIYAGNASEEAIYSWDFDGGSIVLGSGSGPYEVFWPNDGLKNIILTVEENGCTSEITSNSLIVNPQTQPNPICMVTVSESNKNMIVWEVPNDNPYESIVIYKESSQSDVYNEIATQSVNEPSFYIDENSNPSQNSSRYKLAVIDTCGYETVLSDYHKTMHLTINAGIGGAWNLIWDKYEGFEYSTFNIYRGNSDGDLMLIAEQAGNTFTFSDLSPPSGTVYYQIEVVNPNPCDISMEKSSKNDFSSTRSNIVNSQNATSVHKIELNNIDVWPNPVSDMLYINSESLNASNNLIISTVDGRVLINRKIERGTTHIDMSAFPNGIYILQLNSGVNSFNKKIIKH